LSVWEQIRQAASEGAGALVTTYLELIDSDGSRNAILALAATSRTGPPTS
jgi:hypothetical protein